MSQESSEKLSALVSNLIKEFGYVRIVEEDESIIQNADKVVFAKEGIKDEASETRKKRIKTQIQDLSQEKKIAFLNNEFTRLTVRMREVAEVFCEVFVSSELTPREIVTFASQEFYTFVAGKYKQAIRSYIQTTSKAFGSLSTDSRIIGPRFSSPMSKVADMSDRSTWVDGYKQPKKERSTSTSEKKERVAKVSSDEVIRQCDSLLAKIAEKNKMLADVFSSRKKNEGLLRILNAVIQQL